MGTRPATFPGDAASSAAEILHRSNIALARLGRRITGDAVAAGATGFTENNDVQVLLTLRLEGPCSPGRLTEAASMTSGGTTALLDRLERSGLLGRHRDPSASDRRTLDIVLTGEGERVADVLAEATRTALAIRAPEILDLLASLGIGRPSTARLPDVEGAARLMLELASRSEEHTRAIHAAAAAAGIDGSDVLPGRRAYGVCCLVALEGPQSPGAITDFVERTPATTTRLVKSLVGAGLLERIPADPPRRGRAYDLTLTDKGRRFTQVLDRPTPALLALGRALAAALPADAG